MKKPLEYLTNIILFLVILFGGMLFFCHIVFPIMKWIINHSPMAY